jgi:integrase
VKTDSHTRFQVCRLADAGDSLCFNPHATCGFLGSIRVTNQASRFYRAFQTWCRPAGVPTTTVHATRKACASLLVALDVHPRVAMQILRHSQIAVTMDVYNQVTSDSTLRAL